MSMEMKQSKKLKDAMVQLFSTDRTTAMTGLKTIREEGNGSVIHPLLDVYTASGDADFQEEIRDIMSCLKSDTVVEPLVEALGIEKYKDDRALILYSLWSSGFYPSEAIDKVTRAAVEGDYMCAVEALTVIENMEGPFQYDSIEEASAIVDEYLGEDSDDPIVALIENLRELLTDFRANME
jgi:hypothetical protein